MRDLDWYGNYCIDMLNAIDIYPNEIKEFKVNTRAKSRWGQASYSYYEDNYTIQINAILLDENVSERALLETLYHELLHCVDGCMNHGHKWQELADLVNDCCCVNISRTTSDKEKLGEEMAQKYRQEKEKHYKLFQVYCADCNNVITRKGQRAPKWYAHPNYYHCKCGGRLIKM